VATPIFPAFDEEKFNRLWQRRPTPVLRAAAMSADHATINDLLARADEITIQRSEAEHEAKNHAARERLRANDLELPPAGDWITNPYHVGGIELWPAVRDTIVEIIESKANIIILRGGTFSAKSFIAEQLIKRSIAEIGCVRRPHSYLGPLSRTTDLWVQLMHRKMSDARDEMLSKLRASIIDAGWFREHFAPQKMAYNLGVGVTHLRFPTVLVKPVATAAGSLVGRNLFAFWASEANEYDVVEGSSRAHTGGTYDAGLAVFEEAFTRMKRFHRPLVPPIRYIFDSTERYEGDLLARLSASLPELGIQSIVIQRSQWEVKPGALKGPFFDFAKPVKGKRGEIVETEGRRAELLSDRREIVPVPVGDENEYLIAAKMSPDDFARNLGGWPVDAIGRYIDNPDHLARCVREREIYLEGLRLGVDPARAMQDEFLPGSSAIDWTKLARFDEATGAWSPLVLPNAPRAIHFDLAAGGKSGQDYIGMSMGCQIERIGNLPRVWYDFALRLLRDGERYDYERVRAFVEDLRRHGFRICLVTFDSFQSFDFQQILRGWGYQVEQISMVRTIDGYTAFSAGYRAGLALLPVWESSIAFEELVQLERKHVNNREVIEHRPKRHDDVAQAIAAVYWQLHLRNGLSVGAPVGGRAVHPSVLERKIAEATSRTWDQTTEVPQAAKDAIERKRAIIMRKLQREKTREYQAHIERLRARGVRI